MGYYTRHTLEIIEGNDYVTDYEQEIGELSEYGSSTFNDEIKWYNHENDMLQYSKKHPNTIFKIIGEGEENGDMWHEYYKNGNMQRIQGKIVFDDFDRTRLE
jgi:hypothetical protein